MAKTKAKKQAPAWSRPATVKASLAIRELQKVRDRQKILAKKSAMLQQIIIEEGGGQAHGVRAAIRHKGASAAMRLVRSKARTFVVFLKAEDSPCCQ